MSMKSQLESVDHLPTKTFIYALPMIGEKKKNFINIQNCFLWNEDYPSYNGYNIFPIFLHSNNEIYQNFIRSLENDPRCLFYYNADDRHRMFCIEIPDKYKEEMDKFKMSMYSKMSDSYKEHILKFHGATPTHDIGRVLYRDEKLYQEKENELRVSIPRDNEIASVLNPNVETYTKDLKQFEYKSSSSTSIA